MANIEKYHPAAGYSANYAKKKVAEYMKQEEKEDTRKRIRRAPDPLTVNEEDMIVEELIVDETGQLIEVPIKSITTPPKYVIGLRRWAAACRVPRQHMNLLLRVLNTSHGGYPSDYKELMGDSAAVAWEEEELPVEANGTTGSASDPSILRVITDLSAKITQLLEEQENLKHQIRRLSAEQKVRDEAVTSSVKNIKVNVRDMKAYLVKPLDLDIIWPIEDTEVFREVEKKIRINTIYADSVVRWYYIGFVLNAENLFDFFSCYSLDFSPNFPTVKES